MGDHLYVSPEPVSCAQQFVELAQAEACAVSAVQATRESLLPYYGAVSGRRLPGRQNLYLVEEVIEKPIPTEAEQRLAAFGVCGHPVQADLRGEAWPSAVPLPVDAAVAATALHWLSPDQLTRLYCLLRRALWPGGLFLNADHVGSESVAIQVGWERPRDAERAQGADPAADDWAGFWEAYGESLGPEAVALRQELIGRWEGVEAGLPLSWHLDELRAAGFAAVDWFWRGDCDAIYGGVRGGASSLIRECLL